MPGFSISVSHHLKPEEAVQRLKNVVRDLQIQYADKISKVEQSWMENSAKFSFEVMGFSVSGSLRVRPGTAEVEGNIPPAAFLFRRKIEGILREKLSELLA